MTLSGCNRQGQDRPGHNALAHTWPDHGTLNIRRRLGRYVWFGYLDGASVVVKLAADPVRVAALAHEAGMLQKLGPTGVTPRFIAHAELDGHARLLMEHLPGDHPVAPLDTEGWAIRALHRAVDSAHALGVVHCDLKPSNILLRAGRAWLLDWGMSAQAGTPVAELDRRPYSSGWTHPDLIWGRGFVGLEHDLHALARFCGPQGSGAARPVVLHAGDTAGGG